MDNIKNINMLDKYDVRLDNNQNTWLCDPADETKKTDLCKTYAICNISGIDYLELTNEQTQKQLYNIDDLSCKTDWFVPTISANPYCIETVINETTQIKNNYLVITDIEGKKLFYSQHDLIAMINQKVLPIKDIHQIIKDYQLQITALTESKALALADLENNRKMHQKDLHFTKIYTNKFIFLDLLIIIDDFEKALLLGANNDHVTNYLKGFEILLNNLKDILFKKGVKELVVNVGDNYDYHKHQVIKLVESDQHLDNIVTEVLTKGYLFNDIILRPAMVHVVKNQKTT